MGCLNPPPDLPSTARNLFEKRFLDFQKLLIISIKEFGFIVDAGGNTGEECGDRYFKSGSNGLKTWESEGTRDSF